MDLFALSSVHTVDFRLVTVIVERNEESDMIVDFLFI